MEEQEVEARFNSLESGFHIVAVEVVNKIEEIGRDVRELGRESREQGRELRALKRDMEDSFGQIAATMATRQDIESLTTWLVTLDAKMDQLLAALARKEE